MHNVSDKSHDRCTTYEAEDLKAGRATCTSHRNLLDQLSSRTYFLRQMEYGSDALLAIAIAVAIGPISICGLHVLEAKVSTYSTGHKFGFRPILAVNHPKSNSESR